MIELYMIQRALFFLSDSLQQSYMLFAEIHFRTVLDVFECCGTKDTSLRPNKVIDHLCQSRAPLLIARTRRAEYRHGDNGTEIGAHWTRVKKGCRRGNGRPQTLVFMGITGVSRDIWRCPINGNISRIYTNVRMNRSPHGVQNSVVGI